MTIPMCPCGSDATYVNCCGRFIGGEQLPSTPEELMRSRYTAFTQTNMDYIANTMKVPALDRFEETTAREWALSVEWIRLEVLNTSMHEDKGFVEFMVHYNQLGKRLLLHEISEFHLINSRWYYVDGVGPQLKGQRSANISHLGRNEPCLCGSGKKYKKCCGAKLD